MKPNKLVLLCITALFLLLPAGCGSDTGATGANKTVAPAEAEKLVVPEEAPDLVGRVKEIVGNEVTVYLAKMPAVEDSAGKEPPVVSRQGAEAIVENRTPTPDAARMSFNFTEETETFLIPVGVPLAKVQRGTGEAVRMELAEIKKDQLLRIWKKDDAIVFVQVMDTPGSRRDTTGNEQRPPNMGPPGPIIITGGDRQP